MKPQSEDSPAPGEQAAGKKAANIDLMDFADVVVGMSRFLYELARSAPFRDSNLGMAEWVALSILAERGPMNNLQLAGALGVTAQRADQLKSSLLESGNIAVKQSPRDARMNSITITDRGKAQLRTLSSRLKPLIAAALKSREGSLVVTKRYVRLLMRIVQASRT